MSQEFSATNGSVTITSTTATQEEVNAAAGLTADGKSALLVDEQKDENVKETPEPVETQTETAAAAEPAEETEQEQAEEEKPKSKGGFQRRIDKLTADKYRLEGELKAANERRAKEEETQQPAVHVTADDEPKPEDYETTEAYIKAQARWEVRQELAANKAIEERIAQEKKDHEILDTYAKRVDAAKSNHDDWDEVYESLGEAVIPQSVQLALVEMDEGPELVYHLAKNPELREKLNSMSAAGAVAHIGRIAAQLFPSSDQKESAPKTRNVSSAPAPIRPVGGATTKSQKPLDELSMSEYIKAREAGRTA